MEVIQHLPFTTCGSITFRRNWDTDPRTRWRPSGMWSVESEYEFIAVKEKMPSKETDPEIFQISSFLSLYYLVNEAENPPEIGQVSILAFIAFTGKVHEKGRSLEKDPSSGVDSSSPRSRMPSRRLSNRFRLPQHSNSVPPMLD